MKLRNAGRSMILPAALAVLTLSARAQPGSAAALVDTDPNILADATARHNCQADILLASASDPAIVNP